MKMGVKFDYKQAYNKNLEPSARLHYLENARHDQDSPAKKIGPQGLGVKGNNGYTIGSPAKMGHKSPAKKSCSPMNKYGSPMKMGSHAIHKHMGGSAFNMNTKTSDSKEKASTEKRDLMKYNSVDDKAASIKSVEVSSPKVEVSSAKPTKKQAPKSKSVQRKADRVEKTREKGAKALESGNKSKAMRLKRREQRLKKRIAKRS
jgi:hypothetical protein